MNTTSFEFQQLDPRALAELRWTLDALQVQVKLLRLMRAMQKAGFDPTQPRVPAGNPDGGQWADDARWADDVSSTPTRMRGGEAEIVHICVAVGISRYREGGIPAYTAAYECEDGHTVTRSGFGTAPGLIIDPFYLS